MSEDHIFPSRSGLGFVRAKFVFTSETAKREATIMREAGCKLSDIGEHFGVAKATVWGMLKAQEPDVKKTGTRYWQPETIAEATRLRDLGWTQPALGEKYGCSAKMISALFIRLRQKVDDAVVDEKVKRHVVRPPVTKVDLWRRDRSAEMRKPEVEMQRTSETSQRKCLDCNKTFEAPTRFIRLCANCKSLNK